MNKILLKKTAAIIVDMDDTKIAKTANFLRKFKNYLKKFTDPSYKDELEKITQNSEYLKNTMKDLYSEINELQNSINDLDVSGYNTSVLRVKELSGDLIVKLNELDKETTKIEESPKVGVQKPEMELNLEKIPSENVNVSKLEEKVEELETSSKYDVSIGRIDRPLIDFKHFANIEPQHIKASSASRDISIKKIKEAMKVRMYPEYVLDAALEDDNAFFNAMFNSVKNWQLISNAPATDLPPSKTERPEGQMLITVYVDFSYKTKNGIFKYTGNVMFLDKFSQTNPSIGLSLYSIDKKTINVSITFYDKEKELEDEDFSNIRDIDRRSRLKILKRIKIAKEHQAYEANQETGLNRNSPHYKARIIMLQAFKNVMGRDPTLAELQLAQSVAFLESNYGQGWKGAGKGSNNWGAVQCAKCKRDVNGNCPPGSFNYGDSKPTESGQVKYQACFKSYPTPVAGAEDVVRLIFKNRKTAITKALEFGTVWDFSKAMRDTTYYEGFGKTRDAQITNHAKIMSKNMAAIAAANGEKPALALFDGNVPNPSSDSKKSNNSKIEGDSQEPILADSPDDEIAEEKVMSFVFAGNILENIVKLAMEKYND